METLKKDNCIDLQKWNMPKNHKLNKYKLNNPKFNKKQKYCKIIEFRKGKNRNLNPLEVNEKNLIISDEYSAEERAVMFQIKNISKKYQSEISSSCDDALLYDELGLPI